MKRLIETLLDPDRFIKLWMGAMITWLVVILILFGVVIHFVGKYW